MQLYEMQVNKTAVFGTAPVRIPRGIIGAVVKLSFSAEWEGLTKTAVFRAGEVTKDVADIQDAVVIPAECTREEGELLQPGIYGVDAQGTVAIPTLWASIGRITEAADPSGDETTDPSLPVWAQVLEMVKQLEEQGVTQNEVEQAVKDFFGGALPAGRTTEEGGEIFNFYTDPVYTGDNPPKEYPGNTAAKGAHAQNFGTHANGEYSSASGWVSTASGGISDAGGRETEASGYCAVSRGWGTKASGSYAHAGGKKTKATNTASVATGEETEATGYCADAGGFKTKAKGTASFTRGRETEAREYASSTFGRGTVATARNQQARGAWNVLDVPDASGNGTYADIVGGGKSDTDRKNIYTLDWFGNAEFAGKVYSGGVEVAPGGFGLGGSVTILDDYDWNTCTATGWYAAKINAPEDNIWYFGEVIRLGNGTILQRVSRQFNALGDSPYFLNAERRGLSADSGVTWSWSEWEWENPRMVPGAEYRTVEKYDSKPVYVKLISFGKLPNSDTAYVSGISSQVNIVSLHGVAKGGNETNSFPVIVGGQIVAYAFAQKATDGTRIYVKAVSDASAYTAEFILKYTKD